MKRIVLQLFNCLNTVPGSNIIMTENGHQVSQDLKN